MAKEYKTTDDWQLEATAGFEIVLVDEGEYECEVTSIVMVKDVEVARDGVIDKIDMLRWTFTTPDGIELPGTSSTKFGPKSKSFEWSGKILGRDIEIGEVVKPADLVGKSCRAIVKNAKKEVEFNGKKEMQESSRVDTVLSVKKAKPDKTEKK